MWKIGINGANKTKLLNENIREWIVLEQWIYYIDEQNKLYRVKTDGGSKQILVSEFVNSFNISKDYIFYQGFRGIYRVSLNGENKKTLADKKEYWGSLCLVSDTLLYYKSESRGSEFEKIKK